ncbi:nicotinate-nucleotide--dimethylbenzimidazole phosphoribosyltransferase [Acetobacter persici]|uniref:Nicotinate-nucleotide--dimethylbenzimidazole phosphoribosyltransferase n=1 Tax=Acetobacter persici TaxID=1076596 RepID=A0A6V8I7E4_9PROT|nr:nicotinate-nucleotide--dimethylbenzimidazole phosphoribosyltransferase [Acetobacter persici]OUI89918.1 nicotinate-nucleotide--dimethylbenzimidazole phosphoribosyltransferase [Acetobacter persici]GFE93538.1 nicotinate-nucleotide--dimethylbenzimidazole phosphoribosyltransferase [Acetobacter persici]
MKKSLLRDPKPSIDSLAALRAACLALPEADATARRSIEAHEAELTKPAGSLGRLEELTQWLGGWQKRAQPRLDRVQILIFAGNHGVVRQGVSPWPQDVTAQMVQNFESGGAAINQLARVAGATLQVVPVRGLAATADFTTAPAMTEEAFLDAVQTGYDAVPHACDLLCLGEMGIGNTTAAAALAAALFGGTGADWAGRGTGLDAPGVAHKARVIDAALAHHKAEMAATQGASAAESEHAKRLGAVTPAYDPLEIARRLGGYELAALLGATLAARHSGIPVLLDGFVCTAAVAPLARLAASDAEAKAEAGTETGTEACAGLEDQARNGAATGGLAHTRLSHCSAEAGHARLAEKLGLVPLLDLGLRLGEASGAALAVPLLRAAVACHNGMATFAQAAVSGRTE